MERDTEMSDTPAAGAIAAESDHSSRAVAGGGIVNAMSVDVEDYFQVSAFADQITRDDWDSHGCRVERNTDVILQMFADHGAKATFFTLGWVAERYPDLIRRIVAEGHELASHGYEHTRVHHQTEDQFQADVHRTKAILEDIGSCAVTGYRAASFSIDERTPWAFDVLAREGHVYSSSVYPINHDLYGMPSAPRFAFTPSKDNDLLEIPVTTVTVGSKKFPCGGGGYFRLLPYLYSRWAMRRVNQQDGEPCMFYFHPWEIDPEQPRIPGASAKSKFRHYTNLGRMEARLRVVLNDFSWDRVDRVFLERHRMAA
ncbi:XrtA system polysaccharide deacetylase [Pelagibius sp. Alg239-R121]|uniref:XrtA system polysaccharide deacetylase n=1 Tax=Pelagibius sp. Alg239-R121 TaxID=2993448 RepID=UPI0024A74D13|nr:XrtA system polysaccharide deacetylase [Pelagibius sp. Alg239-R121]